MKKVLILASASVATLVCSSALAFSVGVVNMQKVFSSPHGISQIQAKLESEFSGQRSDVVKMMKDLQAEKKNLDRNKAVWSKKKIAAAESKFESDQSKFQVAQAKYQKAVMGAQQGAMQDFIVKIKSAASKAAKKENLDAVFVNNSLLYAKDSKDITSDVLGNLG